MDMWNPVDVSADSDMGGQPSFRSVAEALGLGMVFQVAVPPDRATRRFTYVGPECLTLNGVAPDAAMQDSRALYDLILPEHAERLAQAEDAAYGSRSPLEIEVAMRRPDGEVRWHRIASAPTFLPDGSTVWDGLQTDITEQLALDERRNLLATEMAHRAKNFIAVVMAIVGQTARGMERVDDFKDVLMARLLAMSASQDLVTATGSETMSVTDVIDKALAPFDLERFDIDPALARADVRSLMTVGMGLLLHELATNATKYGALSNAAGRVILRRAEAAEGHVAFEWREVGGPVVQASERKGFGTKLLEQVLRNQGGAVKFAFAPAGFHAHVECPAAS